MSIASLSTWRAKDILLKGGCANQWPGMRQALSKCGVCTPIRRFTKPVIIKAGGFMGHSVWFPSLYLWGRGSWFAQVPTELRVKPSSAALPWLCHWQCRLVCKVELMKPTLWDSYEAHSAHRVHIELLAQWPVLLLFSVWWLLLLSKPLSKSDCSCNFHPITPSANGPVFSRNIGLTLGETEFLCVFS